MDEENRKRLRSQEEEIDTHKRPNKSQTPVKMAAENQVSGNTSMRSEVNNDSADPTLKEVFQSLTMLHQKFDKHATELSNLQKMTVAIDDKVVSLEATTYAHNNDIAELREELSFMKAVIIKQNDSIQTLQSQSLDLTKRSMRDNILIHNIPESKTPGAEDCENLVTLNAKKMGYGGTLTFERIHRLGQYSPHAKFPRPIIGKLNYKEAEALLVTSKSLSRKPNAVFITRQTPAELREKRKKMWEKAEDLKTKDPKCKTKVQDGNLFVNGQLIKETFKTPTAKLILAMNEDDKEELRQSSPRLYIGNTITERGSSFTASVAEVGSGKEARDAYTALLLDPKNMSAAHNIGAYRVTNPTTARTEEEYSDDGEHGAGKTLRNVLLRRNKTNIAVFVTRGSDGTHLGNKRFRLMEDAVVSALAALDLNL